MLMVLLNSVLKPGRCMLILSFGFLMTFRMKKLMILFIVTFLPALVFSQRNETDTTVIKKRLYSSEKFINYLNRGSDASKAVAKVGVAAFTVISYGTFSMKDGFTLAGTGLSGVAFIGSIESCIALSKAKIEMESCGFDKYPDYRIFRQVSNVQAFTIGMTLAGLGYTTLAFYGAVVHNDLAFGIGFGGTLACTVAVSFIPSMIGRIMDSYNKGNHSPVSLDISANGIGLTLKIR
jgi:hypothetical protein